MPKQLYFLHRENALVREETRTLLPWLMQVQSHLVTTWKEDAGLESVPSAFVFSRPLAGAFGGSGEAAVVWKFLESHFPGMNFERGKDFEWGGTTVSVDRAALSRLLFGKEPPGFFLPLSYLFVIIRNSDTPLPIPNDDSIIQDPRGALTRKATAREETIPAPEHTGAIERKSNRTLVDNDKDKLVQAIREALSDGVISESEKAALNELREWLGFSREEASAAFRTVLEEKKRLDSK